MQIPHLYLNGRIVPTGEAAISPFDIGFLRGYAVFDLLRTVNGVPFLFDEHMERFRASAAELGLTVPVGDEETRAAVDRLLELNGHEEATVRFVLTGGVSSDGMAFDPSTPTFLIMTHDLHEPPADWYETGSRLKLVEHTRECPTAKTTNYITMLKHKPLANEIGASDLLYHEGGAVTEAASASFYIVAEGRIIAPCDDVLSGTIGAFVLDLARDDYEIVLRELTLDEVLAADEAFITSTTRGVLPIIALDDERIGTGTPGPVTRDLMKRYREAVFGA